jgi:hypothetical protein
METATTEIASVSKQGRTAWRRLLAVTFLAVIAMLIVAEIALRAVVGLGNPILYRMDPASGYITLPKQHLRRFLARTDLNSHGLRGPEFADTKPPGTLRVMFLGDSIVYGTTRVDQPHIFVELIRKQLAEQTGRRIETINASANAWAITNELGYVRSRGIFGSDYVIDVLNTDDLSQAFARLSDVGELATEKPVTAIGELLSRVFRARKSDAGTDTAPDPFQEQKNLDALSQLADLVHLKGARFAVVFIPFRKRVAPGARSSAPRALAGWAQSAGIPLFDITQAVSSYPVEQITNPDHTHFNDLGNQLIARSLEPQLAGLLRNGTAKTETLHPASLAGLH